MKKNYFDIYFDKMFSPKKLGNLTSPNCFMRSATNENTGNSDGSLSQRNIEIVREIAEGGTGLIITGNYAVTPEGKNSEKMTSMWEDWDQKGFASLVEAAKICGGSVVAQISHAGGKSTCYPNSAEEYGNLSIIPEIELERIAYSFGAAARRAMEAGFDGVQLNCAHGYLLSCFLDPAENNRTDQYGGNVEDRMRFPAMCINAIQELCGYAFPVLIKLNCNTPLIPQEEYLDDIAIILKRFADMGVVLAELSGYDFKDKQISDGIYYLETVKYLKTKVTMPITPVGGVRSLRNIAKILDSGSEMISLSRPFICEPDFITKIKEQKTDISKCITCNKCFVLPKKNGKRCVFEK